MRSLIALSPLLVLGAALLATACGPTAFPGKAEECDSGQFLCGSGECVDRALRCNGTENCADGSDEDDCVARCDGRSDYRCRDGKTCIGVHQLCDGRDDCPGGDDEETCGTRACAGFQCRDGACLPATSKCNGQEDCAGGEDEAPEICAPARCPNEDDMRCGDGKTCVEAAKICDGVPHCPDGDDEAQALCDQGGTEPGGKEPDGSTGRPGAGKPGGSGGRGPQKPGGGNRPGARPCVSVDEIGTCDGDIVVWCDHGRLERRNCAREGKVCGRNSLQSGHMCLDAAGTQPPPNLCGEVSEAGRCDGTTLTFCSRGRVRVQDCAARNQECRYEGGASRCVASAEPAGPDGCGAVTSTGRCGGNDVLEWCEEGEVKRYDCAASGMICQMSGDRHECVAKPCGGVTFEGSCSGDVLSYCAAGDRLVEVDCQANYGLGCEFQSEAVGFNCVASDAQGACGGVSFEGQCDGDTVSWCEDGLNQYDCSILGRKCGQMPDSDLYGCVAPASSCGSVTFFGYCQGDTVVWCSGGSLKSRDCSADGKSCGLHDAELGYWCVGSGASGENSCLGHCGKSGPVPGSSPACWCDDSCAVNGDCCEGASGYQAVCTGAPSGGGSCVGHCGEWTRAPGSDPACYCEPGCVALGDCCEGATGYEAVCAGSSGPSCGGHCGKTSPPPGSDPANPCYCDSSCDFFGDCCGDYGAVCSTAF